MHCINIHTIPLLSYVNVTIITGSKGGSSSSGNCKAKGRGKAVGKFRMSSTQRKSVINKIDLNKFQTSTKMEVRVTVLLNSICCSIAILF